MPLGRRRRPLMRAAAVGGTAYVAGKHAQRGAQREAQQDEQIADLEQGQETMPAPAPPEMAAPPAAAQWTDDRVAALTRLKGLLDDGVLTQDEFDAEKQKILQGS